MGAKVSSVAENSIAEELDIVSGEEILSIDGIKMQDMVDYNYLCKSEFLTIEVQKLNGEIEEIELEKDYDEDLGIVFESAVFDKIKPCLNKCIFCFVDQQPKGLRETLYVKDDDYRLSYLQGTYVTLTNLSEEDKKRIETLRLGPLYVSVHTTNPNLRVKMLKNPNAANIMDNLKWLNKNDIPVHAQIVLCPGYNDGEELERTLIDLKSLKNVLSVAIVPVGLTKFHKNGLTSVDEKTAVETIKIASKYKNTCCSDEFFLLANVEVPPSKYYGNFSQLEDGVGALRLLLDDFKKTDFPKKLKNRTKFLFATSYAAKNTLQKICEELNKITNLKCDVKAVKSEYWGENITVAGLITSDDLINAVKDSDADFIIIPSVMLKAYSEYFLDGQTLKNVECATNKQFLVIKNHYSLKEFADFLNDINIES